MSIHPIPWFGAWWFQSIGTMGTVRYGFGAMYTSLKNAVPERQKYYIYNFLGESVWLRRREGCRYVYDFHPSLCFLFQLMESSARTDRRKFRSPHKGTLCGPGSYRWWSGCMYDIRTCETSTSIILFAPGSSLLCYTRLTMRSASSADSPTEDRWGMSYAKAS